MSILCLLLSTRVKQQFGRLTSPYIVGYYAIPGEIARYVIWARTCHVKFRYVPLDETEDATLHYVVVGHHATYVAAKISHYYDVTCFSKSSGSFAVIRP